MNIIISNTSDKPIYQQLYEQISSQIVKGELESDFCLPPIRTIAKELRISVITVKKAWEELERNGFIYTMVGRGCFVSDLTSNQRKAKRDELVIRQIEKDIAYYKELGIPLNDLIKIIKSHY